MNTVIRLRPCTPEQKKAYMRAAASAGLSLNDWIYKTLDKEAWVFEHEKPDK